MTTTDPTSFIESIKQQLANAPEGVDTAALSAALEALANPEEERVKIWFLLDRFDADGTASAQSRLALEELLERTTNR